MHPRFPLLPQTEESVFAKKVLKDQKAIGVTPLSPYFEQNAKILAVHTDSTGSGDKGERL